MKRCPLCNRTYSNDDFSFCLDDGSLLSAPYDPKQTLVLPKLHNDLPPTLISPTNSKFNHAPTEKEIVATKSAGKRRRWNVITFFEDAAKNVKIDELQKLRRLYEFSMECANKVQWGTGSQKGSFNVVFYSLDRTKSLYTVFSDGTLVLNFGWLPNNERAQVIINEVAHSLKKLKGFDILSDFRIRHTTVYKEYWMPQLNDFTQAVLIAAREF